ncbi:glycosyltransferase family 2 protein [Bacillus sp. OK048]|uniref:glycosyltransferase family 2 protein n=1 Tax=Bacillus sp. OK048 TaxID=1882761 RepID=UPI000884851F|nr:glycosyltransferase family 2 protein [Bacillus sp. OK048]SDN05472.1 Glycosyltransferase involved in cell wall bisynthesis [Bacillus sp. OK048]
MNPLISIIIPVYNVEEYLDRCFESVKKQTYNNLEIIFVNDGSPDNCGPMCDKYANEDNRVKVVHKNNEGLGFARNSGLDVASGDYVAFVDSDDFVAADYIEKLYDAITRNDADTAICGIVRYFNNEKQIAKSICEREKIYFDEEIIDNVLLNMISSEPSGKVESIIPVSVWHELYSMKLINDNNIRFHSEREFISEDAVFQIDYFKHSHKTVIIPYELYYYFSSQEGSLSTKYRKNRFEQEKQLAFELDRKLKQFVRPINYKNRVDRLFLGRVRTCLMMELEHGNTSRFTEIVNDEMVQETLKCYPFNENPIKIRIFNFFLKKKNCFMLKLLIQMKR